MPAHLKSRRTRPTPPRPVAAAPDLQSQLEGLLGMVWEAEANWRLDDRIDLALGKRRPAQS
jgi:hypothetical protein